MKVSSSKTVQATNHHFHLSLSSPNTMKKKPPWPSCHMEHVHTSVLHAHTASPALPLCKPVNVFLCSSTPKKKKKKAICFVWGCSALLEMFLSICLSHLRQHFLQEGTCGGGPVALKSACLTNCGSSAESVAQRDAATSAAGFDTAACGRQRMQHEGKTRQKEDLHPTGETLWSVAN